MFLCCPKIFLYSISAAVPVMRTFYEAQKMNHLKRCNVPLVMISDKIGYGSKCNCVL